MLKVTANKLNNLSACSEGVEWFKCKYTTEEVNIDVLRSDLEKESKESWFNWLIVRLLNKENKGRYAIFAAELVLHIYEDIYPDDKRPCKAIEAAKNYLIGGKNASYAAASDAASSDAASSSYAAAKKETYKKIFNYGLDLLTKQGK